MKRRAAFDAKLVSSLANLSITFCSVDNDTVLASCHGPGLQGQQRRIVLLLMMNIRQWPRPP